MFEGQGPIVLGQGADMRIGIPPRRPAHDGGGAVLGLEGLHGLDEVLHAQPRDGGHGRTAAGAVGSMATGACARQQTHINIGAIRRRLGRFFLPDAKDAVDAHISRYFVDAVMSPVETETERLVLGDLAVPARRRSLNVGAVLADQRIPGVGDHLAVRHGPFDLPAVPIPAGVFDHHIGGKASVPLIANRITDLTGNGIFFLRRRRFRLAATEHAVDLDIRGHGVHAPMTTVETKAERAVCGYLGVPTRRCPRHDGAALVDHGIPGMGHRLAVRHGPLDLPVVPITAGIGNHHIGGKAGAPLIANRVIGLAGDRFDRFGFRFGLAGA